MVAEKYWTRPDVESLLVDVDCFLRVLHAGRGLQVFPLREDTADRAIPLLNLSEAGEQPLVFCRGVIGELKMWYVADVAIIRRRASLYNSEHARTAVVILVFKESAHTQVFRVFVTHFHVVGRPSHSRSLRPPTNASPEINTLFYSSLSVFISRHLQRKSTESKMNA